uniref:Reverse transcriptase domain-containing protein n=1 Tax=Tanacetum cinerariifolium TaxID=118510 RepID=A0A699H3U5_TANCI|nr:reverse transcriptase domain-containing protein [Tanacetum cinerariifolium]
MRNRSKSYPNNSNATIPRRQNRKRVPNIVEPEIRTIDEVVPIADRTMEELLQPPTEGYGEAIVIPEILAENFEIKTNLLQLVQINKFHGFERDNPHTHISKFKRMTSTLKYRDVPNDAIKLMVFPYSLNGAARIWYEKEPPNSILTWDDLVKKFVNQFFPPSKTTHLKNEISRFTQRFEETFREAWERFKEMLRACPHHGFSEESSSKKDDRIDKLVDQISNLVEIVNKQVITPATVQAVEKSCVICGGTLSSNTISNPKGEMKAVTTHSGLAYEGPSILTNSSLEKVVERETEETTDKEQPNCQGSTVHIQPSVVPTPIPEPDVSKTQPKPNIPYPSRLNDQKLRKVPLNENCSAMLLKKLLEKLGDPDKFLIPCDFPGMDVCHGLVDLGASINLMPLSIWKNLFLPKLTPTRMTLELADQSVTRPKGVAEDIFVNAGKFHFPTDFVVVDFKAGPHVPLILGRSFLRIGHALIDVYREEITLWVNDESMCWNKYNSKSGNPTTVSNPSLSKETKSEFCKEPIVKSSSPTLTPFGESDFLVEEIEDFLNNELIPTGIEDSYHDSEVDILYLEKMLNDDPSQLPPIDLKQAKETKAKSSIEEPPGLELKELLSHLEYAFLEETDKLPVIIARDLKDDEKEALLKEDYKPMVQSQRWVNPKIHEAIKKEVIKLLDVGMIYSIYDSPWVCPVHCVPKKGGMTIVANENNELIPTRLVTGWRVCIDYRTLNDATRKDHFPMPFMDQMLERLARNEFYCFLDGFSGYLQISIDPQDQEKTTFTCLYGTFAYRRKSFGLCNAPGTFQRCMIAIFHDMIEKQWKCEDTNLVLNWEKCHFMCKEGIVLGHKISKSGIEVDIEKVDVIAKLPHPTIVKGVRSFLGRVGFYRRFIQDFFKIARPMTYLLEKVTPFVFSKDCIDAFETLKKNLTEAPILVVPDWNLPFELMCDASDFAISAVLGQ